MENASECVSRFYPDYSYSFPVYLTILMKINSFLIVFFNAQVVLCLVVKRRAFSGTYWAQVVCLSISDILSGISVWLMTLEEYPEVQASRPLCSFAHAAIIISQIATLLNIFWICVRRYSAMGKWELPDRTRSILDVFGQMVAVWIVSAAYCAVPFVMWKDASCPIQACSFQTLFGQKYFLAVGYLFGGLFLPLILTNILYLALTLKLRKMLRQIMPLIQHRVDKPIDSPMSNTIFTVSSGSNSNSSKDAPASLPLMSSSLGTSSDCKQVSDCSDAVKIPRDQDNRMMLNLTISVEAENGLNHETSIKPSGKKIDDNVEHTSTQQADKYKPITQFNIDRNDIPNGQSKQVHPLREHMNTNRLTANSPRAGIALEQGSKKRIHNLSMEEMRLRKQRKSLLVIGTVLFLLNTFTWPSAIISALSLVSSLSLTYECKVVTLAVITINSLINPFVYTLRIPEFRKAIKEMYFSCYNFIATPCFH